MGALLINQKIKIMFAKIIKGKDLSALESELNKFLVDHHTGTKEPGLKEVLKDAFPGMITNKALDEIATTEKRLKICNVQQFVVGEVDQKTITLNGQPQVSYSFCLLLICSYE